MGKDFSEKSTEIIVFCRQCYWFGNAPVPGVSLHKSWNFCVLKTSLPNVHLGNDLRFVSLH